MPAPPFVCPQCHTTLRLPESVGPGTLVRCPSCGSNIRVPGEQVTAAPPAAAPLPREGFTDLPTYREGERDDLDRPDDLGEGPGGRGLEGLSNAYSININEWFRYAQAHWSAILGPMIGYMILFAVIYLAVSFIPFAGGLVALFLIPPLAAGLTVVPLAQLKGQRWTFGDFFSGFRWYGSILGSYLLLAVLGLVCILPGLIPIIISVVSQQQAAQAANPPPAFGAPGQQFPQATPPRKSGSMTRCSSPGWSCSLSGTSWPCASRSACGRLPGP